MVDAPKGGRHLRRRASPSRPTAAGSCSRSTASPRATAARRCSSDVTFDVGRGERLLVLGLNGAGKTSLLRILAGETAADAGTVRFGHDVVGRLLRPGARGPRSRPHPRSTTCASRRSCCPRPPSAGLLGMFGLTGEKAFQEAGTLSGGEKTKLALAQLVAGRRNLLLLDEPTNNLDPPSRRPSPTPSRRGRARW